LKIKRDRVFIIVLGIILANLVYYFAVTITFLPHNLTSIWHWAIVIVNGVAIGGCLWLLRTYRRMIKIAKETESAQQDI